MKAAAQKVEWLGVFRLSVCYAAGKAAHEDIEQTSTLSLNSRAM